MLESVETLYDSCPVVDETRKSRELGKPCTKLSSCYPGRMSRMSRHLHELRLYRKQRRSCKSDATVSFQSYRDLSLRIDALETHRVFCSAHARRRLGEELRRLDAFDKELGVQQHVPEKR